MVLVIIGYGKAAGTDLLPQGELLNIRQSLALDDDSHVEISPSLLVIVPSRMYSP